MLRFLLCLFSMLIQSRIRSIPAFTVPKWNALLFGWSNAALTICRNDKKSIKSTICIQINQSVYWCFKRKLRFLKMLVLISDSCCWCFYQYMISRYCPSPNFWYRYQPILTNITHICDVEFNCDVSHQAATNNTLLIMLCCGSITSTSVVDEPNTVLLDNIRFS